MQRKLELKFIDSRTFSDAAAVDFALFEKEIYIPAFPDEGEREPFGNILDRIRSGKDAYPQSFAVLAHEGGELVGGEIYDWYPDCRAAELIYIALKPGCRGAGLGDELLGGGAELLARELEARGERLGRLYFETENPFLSDTDDGMDKVSRIRFFARNSACRVPIRYYQPPLSPGAPWADNLFLCMLPRFSEGGSRLPAAELKEFLSCFYRGLETSTDETKFQDMMRSIDYAAESDGSLVCHNFAEEPQFRLSRFSLAYHFLLDGQSPEQDSASEDPIFNSYECDLMNYSLQKLDRRPVRTRHVKLWHRLTLHLPRFYKYTSEGRDFYRISEHRELPVTVSVNCSENLTRNISLAHLVITPDESAGTVFNELDCIKLITAFGSIQEKFQVPDRNEYGVEDRESGRSWNTIEEFVSSNFGGRSCRVLRNGITELDLSEVRGLDGKRLFGSFEKFRRSALSEEPDESPWNMAFCGLILGIFDFMRMNSAEISDTIKPIVLRRDLFIVLCRGHMMKVKYGERTEDQTANILVSPYLLIPSAVLSINELVLDRNERIMDEPVSPKDSYYQRSMQLSERIRGVMNSLNTEYLQEVFHYSSEQEIMEEGTRQRGLGRRFEQLENRLDKERMLIEEYKSKSQLGPDYFTNAMLAILALLQVTAPFFDKIFWLVLSLAFILAIGAYSWKQLRRRRKL